MHIKVAVELLALLEHYSNETQFFCLQLTTKVNCIHLKWILIFPYVKLTYTGPLVQGFSLI